MARTPLMARLRLLARVAQLSRRSGIPTDELIELPRRRFLQAAVGGLAVSALAGGASCASTQKGSGGGNGPRVAIVGAGIAGLHCAYLLKQGGIRAEVYEAADRTGGRIFTRDDILNPGQTLEIGGSFIDSTHADMLKLCKEFGLPLLDMTSDKGMKPCAYFFDGRHYSEREVLDALKPYVERIGADAALMEMEWDKFVKDPRVAKLDTTGIGEYLDSLGVSGWLRKLLEVAFVTEYGLDANEQSAFNMLSLIGLDTGAETWEAFGDSDERYKVKGGNQRVVDELAKRVEEQIETGRKLEGISEVAGGYKLAFSGGREVTADYVVLTLPFTLLREVKLDVKLPAEKTRAINELGYGMNAKLMIGMSKRVWREQGYGGNIFTDQPFQLAWDNARLQPGAAGGITLYSGGKAALEVGQGTPKSQVERLLPGLEKAYPGAEWAYTGKLLRMHWPSHAFTKASYACYRPGQWTTIAGHEIEPVGNLLFAGEHCSGDFQGYMNGGAETGRVAAEAILAQVGKPK
ncbi:MAG: FAD-dependent oxidoreductase [Planctomycetota bacterium]|nr:FAD-dependent oxidoreductase [Planctomycetota bacterium]